MAKITSLIELLKNNASGIPHLANLTFKEGEIFGWNHTGCAITYAPTTPHASSYLLHEYGHALLGHTQYARDIDLLKMERAAWDKALTLAAAYHHVIEEDVIETSLDTYRDWLHNRSLCPHCGSTGIQNGPRSYQCLACLSSWIVNEARSCALRRYKQ